MGIAGFFDDGVNEILELNISLITRYECSIGIGRKFSDNIRRICGTDLSVRPTG